MVEGIGRTGRLVTGAALIMFFAFAALSTGPETDLKVAATAFGAGIVLDATILRGLLVPALMAVFKDLELAAAGLGPMGRCRFDAPGDPPRLDGSSTTTDASLECTTPQRRKEEIMRIRFVAKDPDSVPDQSPTLYKTDRDSWLVQGWVVTDPATLAEMNIPKGETVVEIPSRLVPFFREG